MSSLFHGLYKKSQKKVEVELIVIGTEVLLGNTLNTNHAFIASKLQDVGFELRKQVTIADDEKTILDCLKDALLTSDVVITTGGLGPTIDDITKKTAALVFASDFYLDTRVEKDLIIRYGESLPTLKNQATIPKKAQALINPVGTAPGLIFRKGKKALILLPGVPAEMKPMLLDQVIPFLEKEFKQKVKPYRKKISLFDLPEFSVDPLLVTLRKKYKNVDFGIYPTLGTLDVQLTVFDIDQRKAFKKLAAPLRAIKKKFKDNIFEASSGLLEEAVQKLFIKKGWTLAVAESCTGGEVSARLTKLPGASNYFIGGVVSYSNSMKKEMLGVDKKLIARKGAVSSEVALAMVKGVLKKTKSDFAIAVSGIAGPNGGSREKPVGTVWMAVCQKGKKPLSWKGQFQGTREMIITFSVNALLGKLLIYAGR